MGTPIILPVIGSQMIIGTYAKLRKKPYVMPEKKGYRPSVSVVIPAKNEGRRIQYALASLEMQTYPVEKVYIIDDASDDDTVEVIRRLSFLVKKFDIELHQNKKPMGKTPGVKLAARKAKTEKILVLDADTMLYDTHYIEKIVKPHSDPKTGSTYGYVRPFSRKEQLKTLFTMLLINNHASPDDLAFVYKERAKMRFPEKVKYYILSWPVERYREALYLTDRYFVKDVALRIYGTTLYPIGCGVLYDTKILRNVFDTYEASLGDNLTTSEDIFIGFSMVDKGYTNIQVPDAKMISAEPPVNRLPKQLFLWASSFLQSAYYFRNMTFALSRKKERPAVGWIIFAPIAEKITYPIALVYLFWFDYTYAIITMMIEYLAYMAILRMSDLKMRPMHFLQICIATVPLRLFNLVLDVYVTTIFMLDLLTGRRDWRK